MYAGKVPRDGQLPLAWEGLCAGAATAVSAVVTNPIEVRAFTSSTTVGRIVLLMSMPWWAQVVKTRLQLQGELEKPGSRRRLYSGVLNAFWSIGRTEGVRGLQAGMTAAVLFNFSMNSVRLGLYTTLKGPLSGQADAGWDAPVSLSWSTLFSRLAAGTVAGCLGGAIGSPFFLVRVASRGFLASVVTAACFSAWWPQVKARLQVQSSHFVTKARHQRYRGTFHALQSIANSEGQACK